MIASIYIGRERDREKEREREWQTDWQIGIDSDRERWTELDW